MSHGVDETAAFACKIEISMLEQQPTRSVLQDIPPADPRYTKLAGLFRTRAQQIELHVAVFRGAGFPCTAGGRRNRRMQRRNDGVEFRFGPHRGVLSALERNHAHLLLLSAPNRSRCSSGS
jgi:hypothetical protein